jgi:hypothetical protein
VLPVDISARTSRFAFSISSLINHLRNVSLNLAHRLILARDVLHMASERKDAAVNALVAAP